jgi:hypothetical protein
MVNYRGIFITLAPGENNDGDGVGDDADGRNGEHDWTVDPVGKSEIQMIIKLTVVS